MAKRRSHGEGTIYFKESKGLWSAQITLPDGKRKTKYAKTQKEVKEWLLEQRKAMADGLLVDDGKLTLGEFLDRWYRDVDVHNLRPSTQMVHETLIRVHIKPALGEIRLSQLTPTHLQSLVSRKLKEGLLKRTVKYIHTVLHQSLNQALKWGLVARNVADAVETPAPDNKKVKPLNQEQVNALIEVLREDRLFPLYVVLLGCGLRRGEALALTLEDVDLEHGLIKVNKTIQLITGKGLVVGEPKSEMSRRTVALPDFAKEALTRHLANRTIESEYVFSTANGTPFIPRNVLRHFKSALKKAGLPQTTRLHDLRHTFVSYLLAQNVPPKDVQEIAGHSSYSTTMDIYGHLMPGAHQEAARKMNRIFGDAEGSTA